MSQIVAQGPILTFIADSEDFDADIIIASAIVKTQLILPSAFPDTL
jgi:hypothetical protein